MVVDIEREASDRQHMADLSMLQEANEKRIAAEALADQLADELRDQWLANHDEHCSNVDPYHVGEHKDKRCWWPQPDALAAYEEARK
jgi:hypothetical protein